MEKPITEIPFKVSARAARLIGRENVANAEGALIELIKNTYDADSDFCIVLFDLKFKGVPNTLSKQDFSTISLGTTFNPSQYYLESEDGGFRLNITEEDDDFSIVKEFFYRFGSIYIIDNGHGMDDKVIIDHWMTIGTDNKKTEIKTGKGRVKTGAKGIGRFALDRLGSIGDMWTSPEYVDTTYIWKVNWEDFEEEGAVIGKVHAKLSEDEDFNIVDFVNSKVSMFENEALKEAINSWNSQKGTIIKIDGLRDLWTKSTINDLFRNLSILIPPQEEKVFNIFLLNTLYPKEFGQVDVPSYDEYDYKLEAKVHNQIATITIYRNEFDTTKFIDNELFYKHKYILGKQRYSKEILEEGKYTYTKKIGSLVPGLKSSGNNNILEQIGDFDFTFYFLKRTLNEKNRKKYKQRKINNGRRKLWLESFQGVRLFRDNFRVRPYGEKNTSSFDWLDLGLRSSGTTNQPSSPSWRVRPHMISGVVNISRLNNIAFEDKSSREGLQENAVFTVFKELLDSLILEFERDRYPIMAALASISEEEDEIEQTKKAADKIATKFGNQKEKNRNQSQTKEDLEEALNTSDNEKETLIKAYNATKGEKSVLEDENKILRVLASTGLIVSAFTHELKTIKNNLSDRMIVLKSLIQEISDKEKLEKVPDYSNPFILIDDIKEEDSRLGQWLEFAIDSIKKDKRRRKKIELVTYFKGLERNWKTILKSKHVDFEIDTGIWAEVYWKGFTIDLDSIFNNLIVNSTEAFRKAKNLKQRKITISVKRLSDEIEVLYSDTGPGLDKDISDPYTILTPHFTTKRNEDGKLIGTGLGMWIVDSVLQEYNGDLVFDTIRPHFKIKLTIPVLKN